jgi:hypothetical protein
MHPITGKQWKKSVNALVLQKKKQQLWSPATKRDRELVKGKAVPVLNYLSTTP